MNLNNFRIRSGKTLEELFFLRQDAVLMEELHRMEKMKETKQSLAHVSGITNDQILQKLVELDVRPETAASLALVPLVEIAWVDDLEDKREKTVILEAATKSLF